MKLEDLLHPRYSEMPDTEKLEQIRHIRSDRHFTKPAVAQRRQKVQNKKTTNILDKLSPEERAEVLRIMREKHEATFSNSDGDNS